MNWKMLSMSISSRVTTAGRTQRSANCSRGREVAAGGRDEPLCALRQLAVAARAAHRGVLQSDPDVAALPNGDRN